MTDKHAEKLTRDSWLQAALELLTTVGLEGIKVVPLAARLGVTSGSFYWHFKNRRELHEALLDYWEMNTTDAAIEGARQFQGTPQARIAWLMEQIMVEGMARYDLPIWQWAQGDIGARAVFQRVLDKRFAFAKRLFSEAGFGEADSEARARMMVVYLMGESTLVPGAPEERVEQLRLKCELLTRQ